MVIPDKKLTKYGQLRKYFYEKNSGISWVFTLTLEIPEKNKVSPLEIPQNCVTQAS